MSTAPIAPETFGRPAMRNTQASSALLRALLFGAQAPIVEISAPAVRVKRRAEDRVVFMPPRGASVVVRKPRRCTIWDVD